MTPLDALVDAIAALRREDLESWVREDLVAPLPQDRGGETRTWVFTESECARVRLICTLRYDLEIADETLPLILSLLDQLYDTRSSLRTLSSAVARQDAQVRARILATVDSLQGDSSAE